VSDHATRIRVLIVDDHASFRSGLRALLDTAGDIEVVGEASSGREATAASARLQPDVILMDVTMPDGNGIEATRRIVEATPHVAIIVLTMDGGDEAVLGALAAGARGYILKGAQRAELFRAIHAVTAGEALFSPAVARRLAGYVSPTVGGRPLPFPGLSEREREVLDLVARGRSNAQITTFLGLSPKTVRNHVSNIFSKLPARDRAEAIVMAREAGMGGEAGRTP
jgi:DNA-binding NarL/FixJ family response regulator